ncbi:response regulator [Ramlibacter sp.]|jgi:DNA-binding NarL/FixJ family response regulator|uniref:response regulator n=1 Tax=Ramlibacter sp. TaxID=1917967 RepID=UPI002FCB3BB1|nr:putative response regulator, CheY [Ramlibacter sp.]MCE3270759.1 putative response regulator, CheY [Ramlibacter sp.]
MAVTIAVFLVEDLRQVEGALTDYLSSLGDFRVVATARTEAEANHWLQEHPGEWDALILDLVLDQGSGMNVISRARAQPGAGKIAVFSGYASEGIRQHCLALGADAVFDKAETAALAAWLRDVGGATR